MQPLTPLNYETPRLRERPRLSRITKSEKNLFAVFVLIIPAIVGSCGKQLNGNIFYFAASAAVGAVVWRLWLSVKDSRSRRGTNRLSK